MQKKRSVLIIVFLLMIVFNENSFTQEDESELKSNKSNFNSHVFDVYLINGYGLGYNILRSSYSEVRLSLDISSSYGDTEYDRKRIIISDGSTEIKNESIDSDGGFHNIFFTAQYLITFYKSNLGESYFGFGPFGGYNWHHYSSFNIEDNSENEYSNWDKSFSMGLTFALGIRSKLNSSLSIFAEAQLNGGKSWMDDENENISVYETNTHSYKTKSDVNTWYYNFSFARIGLRFSI